MSCHSKSFTYEHFPPPLMPRCPKKPTPRLSTPFFISPARVLCLHTLSSGAGIGPRAWALLNPRTQRLVVDVLSKSELVVADVHCLYASVGHKSAVGALRLIMLLGTNPNLDGTPQQHTV